MADEPAKGGQFPDYKEDLEKCVNFLNEFSAPGRRKKKSKRPKYRKMLEKVQKRELDLVVIDLNDVKLFGMEGTAEFLINIQSNARRYQALFEDAAEQVIRSLPPVAPTELDVFDVLMHQRMHVDGGRPMDLAEQDTTFPRALRRRYEVRLLPLADVKAVSIREIRARDIGHLLSVKCMVTRVSDVKPLVRVATYACRSCGSEIYQEVPGTSFMPPRRCTSATCTENKAAGRLELMTRGCRFTKYQEARVQELAHQVPEGHVPRTMRIVCRGDSTDSMAPGQIVTVHGVHTPTPYTGFRAIRAGLIADTYLECMAVEQEKRGEVGATTDEEERQVQRIANEPDPYTLLARSIAPEIYGEEDIKKTLLLQLVGGLTREQADGMRIRGDINVLLMGDPGLAKSQLLKYITNLAPRSVYTTGKGSSGVGLTAAIMKDPVTNELTLEGGALVLADNGICCIDEFDKMDDGDRTAIYEVMEQQTVSIAKAGITTTLNARASILAAANPLYGRYRDTLDRDPQQNLLKNVNLPAALLSRFDLVWLRRDHPDVDKDKALARHICYVHTKEEAPDLGFEPVPQSTLRAYVAMAKMADPPYVPQSLVNSIVRSYVSMRQEEAESAKGAAATGRGVMTPRQLLSILRLAQAIARVNLHQQVEEEDVMEAIRLVHAAKRSSLPADGTSRRRTSPKDSIWQLIMRMFRENEGEGEDGLPAPINLDELQRRVQSMGLKRSDMEECIQEYSELNVVAANASQTLLHLVNVQ